MYTYIFTIFRRMYYSATLTFYLVMVSARAADVITDYREERRKY
jgi:hypothetical protein